MSIHIKRAYVTDKYLQSKDCTFVYLSLLAWLPAASGCAFENSGSSNLGESRVSPAFSPGLVYLEERLSGESSSFK